MESLAHTLLYENPSVGIVSGLMVSVAVLDPAGPQVVAGYEYVTVYVPGELPARFTIPLALLMLNPAGVEVNVPPVVKPGTVFGDGLGSEIQTGVV
jgi:hypothetical protein